jgi:CheY-like chemotaxis protein
MQSVTEHDVRRTALVVDYDLWERSFTSDVLAGEGYMVRGASNGVSGLRLAQQQPCDVILLALALPEMSGAEVLRHLKTTAATRRIPVIVLGTAPDGPAFRAEGCIPQPLEEVQVACEVGRVVAVDNGVDGDAANSLKDAVNAPA